ncbi:hypothetical protein KO494_02075 [Lacinutrix sp. C3R15]|uniref:hypothetical protein n=1 Tax=Flavobacteriaceae TaxID=49546 RepID=UPI001C084276|nr:MULTISPECIES: hypothetical protein [Flavobacteriaceae]MBU2938317.1 hypothetical protein [Lacinutrix sp. C3R15]MDO6621631.1 hypothetical protein [Oceanihabitans sp. 1_MG-2023]
MKKLFLSALAVLALGFTSCIEDDDTPIIIEEVTNNYNNSGDGEDSDDSCIVKSGGIAIDETWTADNCYILDRKVVVQEGVTLTIEPGTIIKGRAGTGSLSSALIVARGGKIMAEGTASQPIIFTSEADNISIGETAGTNLDENNIGLWGGVIVLGRATCSFSGDVSEVQIEGIAASDTFGLYGPGDAGAIDDDNSGVLKYISIRHGGSLLGEGNEINGLTLGGVGSGTTIDNIEVIANKDDGIEFFGGTVNASNILIWAQGDDALDVDQAYSGTISNAVVVLGDASDHALEIDGPEGSINGTCILQDLTLIGNGDINSEYADYRSNAQAETHNVYAYGFGSGADVELDNDGVATNYNNGLVAFSNWEIVLPAGVTAVEDIFANKATTVVTPGFGSEGTAITLGANTYGANTANLSWTYANTVGGLGF